MRKVILKLPLYLSNYRKENKNKTWVSRLYTVGSNHSANYTCLVINASGENGSNTVEVEVKGNKEGLTGRVNLLPLCLDECVCMIGHLKMTPMNTSGNCLRISSNVSDDITFSMVTQNFDPDKFGW